MGEDAGPGPDDVVIDGVWVGEPERTLDQVAAGCSLAIFIIVGIPPLAWWALARSADPPRAGGSPGDAIAWGITFVWVVVAAWSMFALIVSCAGMMGRSMMAAMLWFAGAYAVLMVAIAFLG